MKKKVTTETVVRTIVLVITLVNQVLTMFGKNPLPFAEDELYTIFTAAATIAATLWAWWKNNSFTSEAIEADEYLSGLRTEDTNKETEG